MERCLQEKGGGKDSTWEVLERTGGGGGRSERELESFERREVDSRQSSEVDIKKKSPLKLFYQKGSHYRRERRNCAPSERNRQGGDERAVGTTQKKHHLEKKEDFSLQSQFSKAWTPKPRNRVAGGPQLPAKKSGRERWHPEGSSNGRVGGGNVSRNAHSLGHVGIGMKSKGGL